MTKFLAVLIVSSLGLSAFAADEKAPAPAPAAAPASAPASAPAKTGAKPAAKSAALATEDQKTLYALGLWVSKQVGVFGLSASELKTVEQGMRDGVLGKKPLIDFKDYAPKLQEMAQTRSAAVQAKDQAKALKEAGPEKEKGKAYAEKMAKEKDAQTFPSGLILIPIKEGTGDSPKASDSVKVHYTGTLIDGKVFDSSVQRGAPASFPLSGVIPCWTEGVAKMKVGGKAKLICPSSIAYGDHGSPPVIPPGATLTFEVELLEIIKNEPAKAALDAAAAGASAADKAYQEKAAKEKGAKKSDSGLIYIPITEGKGASPKAADVVKVHYEGTLTDGKVFDSSYKRGEPASFPLNRVIACWTEGVQKMKVGGKAKLVCPASIAYGERGSPPDIPGGATLVFTVELLDIQK